MKRLSELTFSKIIMIFTLLGKFSKPILAIFGKIMAPLLKILKGGSAVKLALGASSFAAYSILFDWRFTVCIMALIGIHESGHVWAMRRMGMATRGFYFIPFFGGAAIPENSFPSAAAESYVALMGPIWGLGTTLITYLLFRLTHNHVFEVAACWMAFVNLLNLIPIYPFDGGRVIRSTFQSVQDKNSKYIVIAVGVIAIAYCFKNGYFIFAYFGILGILDESARRKAQKHFVSQWSIMRLEFDDHIKWLRAKFNIISLNPEDVLRHAQNLDKDKKWLKYIETYRDLRNRYDDITKRWSRLRKKLQKQHAIFNVSIDDYVARITDTPDYARVAYLNTSDAKEVALNQLVTEYKQLFAEVIDKLFPIITTETGISAEELYGNQIGSRPAYETFLKLTSSWAKLFSYNVSDIFFILHCSHKENEKSLREFVCFMTTLLIASYRTHYNRFIEAYRFSRGGIPTMSGRQRTMSVVAYAALVLILFAAMNLTGGHKAAEGAAKFFHSL